MAASSRSISAAACLVAVLGACIWMGCATSSNGTIDNDPVSDPTSTTKQDDNDSERPAFDASFSNDEDANTDPTPPGGDQCIDKDDPGSAENVAKVLPAATDADNDKKTVNGVVNGAVDVDFYKLTMNDTFGHNVDAQFTSPSPGVELCVFVKCLNGTTTVSGCNGGVLKTSEIGTKGCCAAGPGSATPEWDCPGTLDNDSADFFIRVRQPSGDKCLPYSFTYHF